MNDLSIGKKIAIVIVALLTITAISSIVAVTRLGTVNDGYKDEVIIQENLAKLALGLESDILQVRRSEKDFIARKDEKYIKRVAEYLNRADAKAREMTQLSSSNQVHELAEHVHEHVDTYREQFTLFAQFVEFINRRVPGVEGSRVQVKNTFLIPKSELRNLQLNYSAIRNLKSAI